MIAPLSEVEASSTGGMGRITRISSTHDGALLFNVDMSYYNIETKSRRETAKRDAPPACGAGQPSRWALDASTVAGQAAAMTLLWAKERSKQVSVVGSGRCSIRPDIETVSSFNISDE